MDNAPQEPQPLTQVVTIVPSVVLANFGIQRKKIFHTSGLAEHISSVSQLWCLDHDSFFEIENVFITEEIDPPSAVRELAVEEGGIV